ncbi:MAG TPA: hypothetical protein VF215_16015, partial [Thermoanaerobaculia bacterium]
SRWLVPIALLAIAITTPFALRSAHSLSTRLPADVERDWAELAKHIPPGAKVVASWGATDAYVFFAPQGRYLNVLDPAMMFEKNPRAYWTHRAVLDGTEPDLARVTKTILDSDYIAFPKWEATPLLMERVSRDPHLERLYNGYHVLLRVK